MSLNWYRVQLVVSRERVRPVDVAILLDRPLYETPVRRVSVRYGDREEDPFIRVPDRLLAWVPGAQGSALPLLVVYALAIGGATLFGCAAAFRIVRR
jgi:hypothetical protein